MLQPEARQHVLCRRLRVLRRRLRYRTQDGLLHLEMRRFASAVPAAGLLPVQ